MVICEMCVDSLPAAVFKKAVKHWELIYHLLTVSAEMAYWRYEEACECLICRAEDQIAKQFMGTVKDSHLWSSCKKTGDASIVIKTSYIQALFVCSPKTLPAHGI